jgi:ABC-type molybdate transport system ATPase subunit
MHQDPPPGNNIKLRVIARDVSLTPEHQTDSSILNIFPNTIAAYTFST